MIEKAEFQMTIGSKYRIKSLEAKDKPLVSQGTFQGFTAFGHNEAICLLLDESHGDDQGKIRVLPGHMVVALDVLSSAENKKEKEQEDNTSRYFA